jgi:hypothetical protein
MHSDSVVGVRLHGPRSYWQVRQCYMFITASLEIFSQNVPLLCTESEFAVVVSLG